MRAIETTYNGRRFRSRLEARWAVFFDVLGIRWDYEPEGFRFECVDPPVLYLPDFWLPDAECWVEIKPAAPTPLEHQKCALLASYSGKPVVMLTGQHDDVTGLGFFPWTDGFVEEDTCTDRWIRWLKLDGAIDDALTAALQARFEFGAGRLPFTSVGDVVQSLAKGPRTGRALSIGEIAQEKKPRTEGDQTA